MFKTDLIRTDKNSLIKMLTMSPGTGPTNGRDWSSSANNELVIVTLVVGSLGLGQNQVGKIKSKRWSLADSLVV